MRRIIIILIGTFFCLQANAQYNPSFIGARLGVGIPYSKFNKGLNTVSNGFASFGGNIVVEGAYFYSENVGVGGLISNSIFPVDEKEYGHQFVKNNCIYSEVIVNSEYYYTVSLMGGLYFSSRFQRTGLTFTGKILAGIYWVRNPAVLFTYIFSNVASSKIYQKSENNSNFAIYYGLGLKYDMWENLGLSFDLDYVGSRFRFYYNSIEGDGEATKQISYLSVSLGVFLKL